MKRSFVIVLLGIMLVTTAAYTLPDCDQGVPCYGDCSEFGGGGGGGGGGATPTPSPPTTDPPVVKAVVGQYSYANASNYCTGNIGIVDPISLVVDIDQHAAQILGVPASVSAHINHHGLGVVASTDQYFHRGLGEDCVLGEISRADAGSGSRNHTRGLEQDSVVAWGYGGPWRMAGLTPHYDRAVPCGGGHAVPENLNPPGYPVYSGYSATRDMIISNWLAGSDHHRYVLYAHYWGNIQSVAQCTGERPSSDGWVYFLGVCEVRNTTVIRGAGDLSC